MKNIQKRKQEKKQRRYHRVRKHVRGTHIRPRLSVFRSLSHISAQLIDDEHSKTLVICTDKHAKDVKDIPKDLSVKAAHAYAVGIMLAQRSQEKGITHVAFDRGSYRYHGRVKALAEGARAGGLIF